MKKFISVIALALAFVLSISVLVSAEQVSSTGSGFSNVSFSNGYYGFCIDANLAGAYSGDVFTPADSTSVANNNNEEQSDVSQLLKILFTQCFEEIFVSDGNGGYVMDSLKADSSVQSAVWHFTDGRYVWGESKTFTDAVKAYDGPEIPDNEYVRQLENGDRITFYFMVVEPHKEGQQSFFAYKIEVNQESAHTHDYSDEWSSDDANHWYECECGDRKDEAPHEGNKPDCITSSVCNDCGKKLADADSENHTGNTEIKGEKSATAYEDGYTGDIYCSDCDVLLEKGETIPAAHTHDYSDEWSNDDANHWYECECGDRKDNQPHTFVSGECSVCGKPDADTDVDTDKDTGVETPDVDKDEDTDAETPDVDKDEDTDAETPDVDKDKDTGAENSDTDANKDASLISPDTGISSYVGVAFLALTSSMCVLAFLVYRKRKESAT